MADPAELSALVSQLEACGSDVPNRLQVEIVTLWSQ
jgi:hypothetical protein